MATFGCTHGREKVETSSGLIKIYIWGELEHVIDEENELLTQTMHSLNVKLKMSIY